MPVLERHSCCCCYCPDLLRYLSKSLHSRTTKLDVSIPCGTAVDSSPLSPTPPALSPCLILPIVMNGTSTESMSHSLAGNGWATAGIAPCRSLLNASPSSPLVPFLLSVEFVFGQWLFQGSHLHKAKNPEKFCIHLIQQPSFLILSVMK